jgi:hypothetical protein
MSKTRVTIVHVRAGRIIGRFPAIVQNAGGICSVEVGKGTHSFTSRPQKPALKMAMEKVMLGLGAAYDPKTDNITLESSASVVPKKKVEPDYGF